MRPYGDHRAAFSVVVAGNQIAESALAQSGGGAVGVNDQWGSCGWNAQVGRFCISRPTARATAACSSCASSIPSPGPS